MIDMESVRRKILANSDYVYKILEELGYDHIVDHHSYFSFPHKDGDNLGACNIYLDNLGYKDWSRGNIGSLFDLVMEERHCSLAAALEWICGFCGFTASTKVKTRLPFGGFFKQLKAKVDSGTAIENEKVYDESILPTAEALSQQFCKDGISYLTQEKWGVRYSSDDKATLIPIRSYTGELVGIKCRNNDPNCRKEARYWAKVPFSKTKWCYGWHENYESIRKKKAVVIFEAEKSVMKCSEYGLDCAIAIGGHSISDTQQNYIKMLQAEKIILAFDEGIPEEECEYECKKLKVKNRFFKNRVGYIKPSTLPKGSKDSPADLGKKFLAKSLKEVVWI